jgi:hypothetical protein
MALQENTTLNIVPHAADLKLEVEALIKPHLDSLDCPPFPLDELAVMAWVCCRNHLDISTEKDMYKWLVENFKYYRNFAVEDIYRPNRYTGETLRSNLNFVVRNMTGQRFGHEMPVRTLYRQDATSSSVSGLSCITTLANSRQYLRRAMGRELKEFPQFFALPPELRLMIYQHVFCMEGVLEHIDGGILEMVHDYPEEGPDGVPECMRARKVATHRVNNMSSGKTLSLLLSNRQIFREAMPVFYNVNTFRVLNIFRLVSFLRRCGPFRRAQITRIEVEQYCEPRRATTKEVFELLAEIKQLQYLKISTDDQVFLKKSTTAPKNIPWVKLICKMKVASLHVESVGGRI